MTPTSRPKLMAHQEEGIRFLKDRPRAALLDEPGLGKSAQALLAAEEPILVTAPAMVITGGVWDDEIAKWRPGADVTQIPYSRLFERDGLKSTDRLALEARRHWGTVIADEAHYLKGRNSFWTKAFYRLHSSRTYQLTGTPIPNWAHEAFVLLTLLYPEEFRASRRFGSYWRWAKEWFEVGDKLNRKGEVLTKYHVGDLLEDRTWEEFREANWGDRALLRLREDVLDLPELTQQWIRVDLEGEQKRAYKELKRDFVTWLDSGEELVAWNSAHLFMKLFRVGTSVGHKGAKLKALRELLELRDSPTLVVAHFQKSVEDCDATAGEVGESAFIHGKVPERRRQEILRMFKMGKLKTLCASIATISEGLTLNRADHVVFVERSFVPSKNEQVLRRIHRIGQTKPVTATHLVARDTIDDRVLELLEAKSDQQFDALPREAIRALV